MIDITLPFWIFPEDVSVQILEDSLRVSVRNELSLHRTYWKNRQAATLQIDTLFIDLGSTCYWRG